MEIFKKFLIIVCIVIVFKNKNGIVRGNVYIY